jgi:hypothetical protein
MHRGEFEKRVQAEFAFKIGKSTMNELFKLANDYAASYLPDHDLCSGGYKMRVINKFLNEVGFEDDSWPNYEGWAKDYDTFTLLIYVSERTENNFKFTATVCEKGLRSAADPHNIRKPFTTIRDNVEFSKIQETIIFFNIENLILND